MKYEYSFVLWVRPHSKFSKALVECLRLGQQRVCLDMTEDEFSGFRYDILLDGFDLHEIERRPFHEPEVIF